MKDKVVAGLLGIFLGAFGIHKFYLGRTGQGIIYLLFFWTLIPSLVGFIEGIIYIAMSQENFDRKYNQNATNNSALPRIIKEKADGTTVAICPACAEEIKPEAIKCKHCGTNIK